jgi:hypothetical protein
VSVLRQDAAQQLADLAERGCELAAGGQLDELATLDAPWAAAMAQLRGAVLSASELVLVLRAQALQGEQAAFLESARVQVGTEIHRVRETRAGARGYATGGLPPDAVRLNATA